MPTYASGSSRAAAFQLVARTKDRVLIQLVLTTEECQQILLAADFMDELMLLLRPAVYRPGPVESSASPPKKYSSSSGMILFRNTVFSSLKRSSSFRSLMRVVGMPHRVVTPVVQGLDPLVEHDQCCSMLMSTPLWVTMAPAIAMA